MRYRDGEELVGTITRLIGRINAGDETAQAEFCELVYSQLRGIGRRSLLCQPGCSLSATEIVNEFLGRVMADGRLGQMKNRRYFYKAAADQMRRLLIDHWRHKKTQAQGGHLQRVELDPWLDEITDAAASRCGGDLEVLELALDRLMAQRPRQYEVVQLKFFGNLNNEQIADTLNVSVDTVKRDWKIARARLGAAMSDDS